MRLPTRKTRAATDQFLDGDLLLLIVAAGVPGGEGVADLDRKVQVDPARLLQVEVLRGQAAHDVRQDEEQQHRLHRHVRDEEADLVGETVPGGFQIGRAQLRGRGRGGGFLLHFRRGRWRFRHFAIAPKQVPSLLRGLYTQLDVRGSDPNMGHPFVFSTYLV